MAARRWRPPDRQETGQHPRKVPPAPKAKLASHSDAIIAETGHGVQTRPAAFAAAAVDLWRLGLFPIPLGGADGKRPLIQGFTRMPRPSLATIEAWTRRFPGANVGILTGAVSGVTVIDIDSADRAVRDAVERRFGSTTMQVSTPSGGRHSYFRDAGELCRNLRPELPVDVKASGGFVVVPPSTRPIGDKHAGKAYAFAVGASWADLAHLQPIKPGALAPGSAEPVRLRAVGEGRRNSTLFRALLKHAPACDDFDALLDVAQTINEDCTPPLPGAEVEKTARSAWKYQRERRNWAGHEARAVTTAAEIAALDTHTNCVDALYLMTKLKMAHGARAQPFAASPPAMARAGIAPGWAHERYRYALAALVAVGELDIVHKGGRSAGDPRLYAFRKVGPLRAASQPVKGVASTGAETDDDDDDLLRVVDLLKAGLSIRKAGETLGMDKSKVLRLKHRAAARGLLSRCLTEGSGFQSQYNKTPPAPCPMPPAGESGSCQQVEAPAATATCRAYVTNAVGYRICGLVPGAEACPEHAAVPPLPLNNSAMTASKKRASPKFRF